MPAALVTPHLGDVVELYQDDSTGHGGLLSAARWANVPPYFALYP